MIKKYNLSNVKLIYFDRDRIPKWLIDNNLYEKILVLENFKSVDKWERLSKKYLAKYYKIVNEFIKSDRVKLLIGAQDENSIYSLIKLLSKPDSIWSIEDGLANYYLPKLTSIIEIKIKNLLFKYIYGYNVDIANAHGDVEAERYFRIEPSLCINSGNHLDISNTLSEYILKRWKGDKLPIFLSDRVLNKEILVVSNYDIIRKKGCNSKELYKFHPNEIIGSDINGDYVSEPIPIEILVFHLRKLKKIRFDVMSSSLLNVLKIMDEIEIEVNFSVREKRWTPFFEELTEKYVDRIHFSKS